MPKPKRKSKTPPKDANVAARKLLNEIIAIGEVDPFKNPAAVALGRLGGLKGGKARAQKLDGHELSEIARKAANARWEKARKKNASKE